MNILKQSIFEFVSSCLPDFQSGFSLFILKVTQVDRVKRIIAAEDDNGNIFPRISLRLIGGSVLPVPAVGSYVLVLINQQVSVGYVLQCSKIESAEIVIGGNSAVMDADGLRVDVGDISARLDKNAVTFNGGKLGGLVRVEDLTKRLNIIENDINKLKTAVAGWTPVPQDGGAALKTAVASWAGSQLTPTKRDDYENKKVTQ